MAEAERVWRTQMDRRGESAAHTARFVQELLLDVGDVPLSELRGDGSLPYTGALARKSAIERRLRNMIMDQTPPDLDEDDED
ncbi:hypothetical protein [Streptomyces californicus]|uniref:hypothetical protein n=1 Tax=Streptomyces californicus TaxID=67351 RepID=UPI00381397E4